MTTTSAPTPRRRATGLALLAASAVGLLGALVPASAAHAADPGPAHFVPMTLRASADADGTSRRGGTAPLTDLQGEHVAYAGRAANGKLAVEVKDLRTGRVVEVSKTAAGQSADGDAIPVGLDAAGGRVAFLSTAPNLGGTGGVDLYLRDLAKGTTTRVNLSNADSVLPVARLDRGAAALSADGSTVAWESSSPGGHLFVRDLKKDLTNNLDVNSSFQIVGGASNPVLSTNGQIAAFESSAAYVPADTNGFRDVYVLDRSTTTPTLVSAGPGSPHGGDGDSFEPSISGDGRAVAFTSVASDLEAGDTNGASDVYEWHRSGVAEGQVPHRVSKPGTGVANGSSGHARISGDGSAIAFQSFATNLVAGDTNGQRDVFQVEAGKVTRTSVATLGAQTNGPSSAGGLDRTGGVSTFSSTATNLTAGDGNGIEDAFVRDLEPIGPHGSLAAFAGSVAKDFGASALALQADLEHGRYSPAHAVAQLAHAPAWAAHREAVIRLYFAFFERFPDQAGMDFWIQRSKQGQTLAQIATQFAKAAEFKATYGTVGNAGFVSLVYNNVLDRTPDSAGLQFWTTKMAAGLSRGDVMVAFSESPEGRHHLAPDVDPVLMGLGLLHRMPDASLQSAAAAFERQLDAPEAAAVLFLLSDQYGSRF